MKLITFLNRARRLALHIDDVWSSRNEPNRFILLAEGNRVRLKLDRDEATQLRAALDLALAHPPLPEHLRTRR